MVAIILIIAAIAIPNLIRTRMPVNDSPAAASEHTPEPAGTITAVTGYANGLRLTPMNN